MDCTNSEERDLLIDLECGRITSEEGTSQGPVSSTRHANNLFDSVASGFLGFNEPDGGERGVNSYECNNLGEPSEIATGNVEVLIGDNLGVEENGEHSALVENKNVKEKRKMTKYQKASKPPRPPNGPSIDAADLKLIKEISAAAMKKRARSEHLKASRKLKEAKSLSSASKSSISAMVITILFFVVIIFQGFCSRGSSRVSFLGSPEPAAATDSLISVQFYNNPSASGGSGLSSESPNSKKKTSGSEFRSIG